MMTVLTKGTTLWSAPARRRFGRLRPVAAFARCEGSLVNAAVKRRGSKRRQTGSPARQPRWGAHAAALQGVLAFEQDQYTRDDAKHGQASGDR